MAIIVAALNAAGHDVQMPNKTGEKTEKQLKRTKKAGKKANRKEMEEKADTEHPEWGMNGDYKFISDKVLREALESGIKPRRKPLTGYMFFLGQVRGELKDEGMKGTEVAKEAGRRWRELDAETKEHYKEQAIDDLETKYGPQSESEDKKKKPKKTRQPRKKAPARKAVSGGGGGSKEPRKQRKQRKRVATPEPEHEDTPAAPTSGLFDSSDSSSDSSDSDDEE